MIFDSRSNTLILETSALFGIPWSWTVGQAPKNARTENIFCYSGYKFTETSRNEILSSIQHHQSLLSSRRMRPLILFLQATLCLSATSACLQVLNPRCSLSLFTILCHVSLGRPFLRLPLGAQVSVILGFLSDGECKE